MQIRNSVIDRFLPSSVRLRIDPLHPPCLPMNALTDLPPAALYGGSGSEWSRTPGLPMAQG